MIERCLELSRLLQSSSHFLLGPRAVGKSTLIKQCFAVTTPAGSEFDDFPRFAPSKENAPGVKARNSGLLSASSGKTGQKVDYINLLNSKIHLRLKQDPSLLSALIHKKYIVIDEIQRIPELLNEVHRLIEDKGRRFLLTGSSARKLKRGNANLLIPALYTLCAK